MRVLFTVLITENVNSNHCVSAVGIMKETYLTSYLTDAGASVSTTSKSLLS